MYQVTLDRAFVGNQAFLFPEPNPALILSGEYLVLGGITQLLRLRLDFCGFDLWGRFYCYCFKMV
jgi:hypothetical protein